MIYARKILVFLVMLGLVIPVAALKEQPTKPQELKPLEISDVLLWKSIALSLVSHDGKWFAYQSRPRRGDSKLFVRQTGGEKEYSFAVGETSRVEAKFSSDSNWLAFNVHPSRNSAKKLKKKKKPMLKKLKLVKLTNGKELEFDKVQAFSFSKKNPNWLALHKYAPEGRKKGEDGWSGKDLILYNLNTDAAYNIGNVSEYVFDKKGKWLAYIIDAQEKNGNGIHLRNLAAQTDVCLDSGKFSYSKLNWNAKEVGLCVLRGEKDKNYKELLYSVIGFKNFSEKKAQRSTYEPLKDKNFPKGMTISKNQEPRWTKNLQGLVFGIQKVEKKEDTKGEKEEKAEKKGKKKEDLEKEKVKKQPDEEDKPGVVLWHWKDKRLQSQQQKEESKDKNYSFLSIYWVDSKTFVRLADDELREVKLSFNDRTAVGFDRVKYMLQYNLDGVPLTDIYTIDIKKGNKKLVYPKCKWDFDVSPNGKYLLYFGDGHFHTLNLLTGQKKNITVGLPTSFIDEKNDENIKDLPNAPIGWTSDSRYVLLYDNWDVWKMDMAGRKGMNLTVNGRKESIRYERRFRLYKDMEEEEGGIDLKQPQYFRMYGEWTKKGGIARVDKGKAGTKVLRWGDMFYRELLKPKDANILLYRKETHKDYPNFFVTDSSFQSKKQVTDVNPQQKDYIWSSGNRLLDYTSHKGEKLQAALFLPADYKEGQAYPTIVYIYEELSAGLNRYESPRATGFSVAEYTSRGYAVLKPDIVYKINDPGMSAVWCVLPALKAAVATGIVDKDKVGLQGHSWGGYQTAFLVTQTEMFAAAVAGAPLTNMISMYSSIYWNVGIANQQLFESGQGRFSAGYWEIPEAYIRNSPVFHAKKVNTPLIILHNDKDGAVDWNQGIEYYNTLRRMEKPVIMLQYKGENHGVRKMANRIDYTYRMRVFFDHYLMGKPAPEWLTSGVPHLEIGKHLEEIAKKNLK